MNLDLFPMKRVLVVIFVFFSSLIFSQDLSYKHFSTHNGLPSNQVYNIYQDNNGFIWFATDRGIAKYDGDQFTLYDQSDGLTSSTIFRFFPQKNGDVWCSTFQNKWFYFNPDNIKFTPYAFNDTIVKYSKGGLNENFYLSNNGTIYIGYQNANGFLAISKNGELLHSLEENNDMYIQDSSNCIVEYDDEAFFNYNSLKSLDEISERLRVLKHVELHRFPSSNYHKEFKIGDCVVFSNGNDLVIKNSKESTISKTYENRIIGLGKYDDKHIWVGFVKGGLKIISLNGELVNHYLDNKSVTFCSHDFHGGFWMSTLSNGVFYSKNSHIKKYTFNDDDIYFVANGKEDNVIVGTIVGDNYEINNDSIELFSSVKIKTPDVINYNKFHSSYISAYQGFKDRYSFNSKGFTDNSNLISLVNNLITISNNINKPFLAAGTVKFMYWNKSINSISTVYINNRIRSVSWCDKGIYIGTLNGLFKYDTINLEIKPFNNPLLKNRVEVVETYNNKAYIGTMGGGLVVLEKDSIIQIAKKDGLSSNLVNKLFVENDSIIWLATNNGLNRVLISNSQISVKNFNEDDGLVDSYINDVFIKGETVWVATRSGLCSMSNNDFVKDSTIDLFLKWAYVESENSFLSDSLLLNLDYKKNNLNFHFNAAYFSAENGIEFRYKLVGQEDSWNYTSLREIKYFSLNSGSYEIKVQASINGSDWSVNEITKSFVIYPPFYQTNWFYLLIAISISSLIYLFFKIRVLTYNRDIVRELLRLLLKKITPKTSHFTVKDQGLDVKVNSQDVLYVKASGNYLELYTTNKRYLIRCKIGDFLTMVPDKIEYVKINRSHIVRKDKIQGKSSKSIQIAGEEFVVSKTYQKEVNEIVL